ncbi:MAG: LysR family transcriptional regulator substrate-binding protein [Eggerthellaceae bacterium]|nr:LysR family transcriptional regulator substrate-binding protein [Eggerthellaceae bacterium]
MSDFKFAVSGQHYLFNVQTFASVVLSNGGDEYEYAFRDRTTQGVIDDVASGASELGVLVETTRTADDLEAAFAAAGLEFVELIQSSPRVALPASHPLINADKLSLEQLEDYPYIYFEQGEDAPVYLAEEALADEKRHKGIACTDRASLSELIVALNGYTVTSGILVGISDGAGLNTVPLDTDVKLHLGYVVKKGAQLSETAQKYVAKLESNLKKYARF